jgi:hypothetical protein
MGAAVAHAFVEAQPGHLPIHGGDELHTQLHCAGLANRWGTGNSVGVPQRIFSVDWWESGARRRGIDTD